MLDKPSRRYCQAETQKRKPKRYLARRALEVDAQRQVAAVVKAAEFGRLVDAAHLEGVGLRRLLLWLGLGHAQRGRGAAGGLGPFWGGGGRDGMC